VLLATLVIAILPLSWEDRKPVWVILAALLGLSEAWVAGNGGAVQQLRPRRAAPVAPPPVAARGVKPLTAPGRNTDRNATV